jgi:C1A family cysteine protease/sugar lactone lactonase YvrE
MISSVELSMSYGTNPVNTVSHVLSQAHVNSLVLGTNIVPITSQSVINILNNADSNVDFIPSLKITYNNGTSSTAQGTTYNDPPQSSRYGWQAGEAYSLIQPKIPSLQATNTVSNISLNGSGSFVLPYLYQIPVYDQEQLGSCTANATAFCFDYCRLTQGLPLLNLPSRLFIYYNERNYEGTTASDHGAQIYDGVKVLNEIGVCSSTLWPYEWPTPPPPSDPPTPPLYLINYKIPPPQNCYSQASQNIALTFNAVMQPTTVASQSMPAILQSINGIQTALVSGYPVVFAFTVFPFFEYEMYGSNFILQCPVSPIVMSTSLGGHAVVIVGYDNNFVTSNGNGAFLVRNSWGTTWGTSYINPSGSYNTGPGYFWMPYQYFTNQYTDTNGNIVTLTHDLWTINTVATNNVTVGSVDPSGNPIYGYGQLQFYQPNSVAVDLSGNYVIADTFNNRIQVVSPSGQFIRFIGSLGLDAGGNPLYGSGNCQFYQPSGVAVDLSGNYVIADTYNDRIQVISPLGVFIRQFGSYATGGNGYFNAPDGVAVDLSGNYVIADSGNNLIQVVSPLGIFQRQFTSYINTSQSNSPINFNNPEAVAIDLSGNYVVSNSGSNCIVVISPLGNFVRQFGFGNSGLPAGDGNLNYPTGVAVDLSGNYLVADSGNNLIQIFTPSGEYYSELGSVSLTSTNGSIPGPFTSPQGVAVDKTGKYIVVDSGNSRILAFNV